VAKLGQRVPRRGQVPRATPQSPRDRIEHAAARAFRSWLVAESETTLL
jgi:hypothetical protein